jgi:lipoteichoic acid synthase
MIKINTSKRAYLNSPVIIFSTAITLCIFLLVIRAHIIGIGWDLLQSPLIQLPKVLMGPYYDFLFVAVITLPFLALFHAARYHLTVQRIIYFVYTFISLLTFALALLNIKMIQMLGSPFNYRWLYYSDFLSNLEFRPFIHPMLTWNTLLLIFTIGMGMIFVSILSTRGINLFLRKYISEKVLFIYTFVICLIYFPLGSWYMNNINQLNYPKLENAAFSLLHSILATDAPKLFTMTTPVGPEDFLVAAQRHKATTMIKRHNTGIRNILFYVLESVPAEYIDAYDGRYSVTPELNKYRGQSMLFKNIYAHAPISNKSLVSILCSIYPWISHITITREHPDVALSSLSSELKQRGYRTAFFSSGEITFQHQDKFLAHRHFDVVQDNRTRTCGRTTHTGTSEYASFFEGSDDECTVDSFIKWVNAAPEQPFFAMIWTNMTHFPYYAVGEETNFGVDMKSAWDAEFFNRYLNALRHIDLALGKVLRMLQEQGLANSTLVVVFGDHGEAFAQHGQYGHGANIYEENVHVPLILINPRLFNGEADPVVGGLVDLAPTIMDLLNFGIPGDWQGRSLFSKDRSNRAYFFTPMSEFMFGYREDDRKFIFKPSSNKYEIYDLVEDPRETVNLAKKAPDNTVQIPQRLAAWVQYQNRLINDLISPKKAALK